jgi:nucleotide sugar dehydrogenase
VATTDYKVVKTATKIIICVPTPIDENHQPDLEPVISSCQNIAKFLKKGQLVVLESTVNPGTMRETVIPILEKASGMVAGKDFYVAYCPERINPGSESWNVENIPRVVGSLESIGLDKATKFYQSILLAPVQQMQSMEEAEAVKIVENCFRDINIAFVNEFAMSFAKLGIDVLHVLAGAATKPFAFFPHYPGCGVGGHCIPVDPYYMIEYAQKNGFSHKLLSQARETNNNMPSYTVNLAVAGLKNFEIDVVGSKIAVLGLAYKKNIDDCRESPSFEMIKLLKALGANVTIYDPHVQSRSTVHSLEAALEGSNAVIIATDHDEFTNLTPESLAHNQIQILIDGRNCMNKEAFVQSGIYYKGIGR